MLHYQTETTMTNYYNKNKKWTQYLDYRLMYYKADHLFRNTQARPRLLEYCPKLYTIHSAAVLEHTAAALTVTAVLR